jgi:ABC-type nitrate/sulfonate/bicarbonate transport system substrate-binding protein
MSLTRRGFLGEAALAFAGALTAATFPGLRSAGADPAPIRVTDGGPGTAGAIWRPLIDSGQFRLPPELKIDWVNGTPGLVQLQVATGAANVAVYGPIGAAEIAPRGSDIVIVGPALNNHGRWLVRDNSGIRNVKDLAGKTVAALSEASDTFRQARLAALLNGFDLKKETKLVFGTPTANVALFERGDADAVITIEPTATRLVARGAREIARTGDLWQAATNDAAPLFLVGLAAHRPWAQQNRAVVSALGNVLVDIHRNLRANPQRLSDLHKEFGIPDSERAAVELLPRRIVDIYSVDWGNAVFANIDRQIDEAVKIGILPKRPDKPVYDASIVITG